jgi:hypothetical protein
MLPGNFSLRIVSLHITVLLSLGSPWHVARADVYRCNEDGEIVFSNSPASAKQKNCVRIKSPSPARSQLPRDEPVRFSRPAPSDNLRPTSSPSPNAFPKVDASTQKFRDNDRAAILDEERRKESSVVADLKREFNNGAPERRAEERDQHKYLERVEKLRQGISRAEANVKSLERELQSVK